MTYSFIPIPEIQLKLRRVSHDDVYIITVNYADYQPSKYVPCIKDAFINS